MKAIATEGKERSIPAEDALRLVVDTTPALIHSGRPDGYLDYFNRRWLEFLGLSLEEVCGWRWTGSVPDGSSTTESHGQLRLERFERTHLLVRRNVPYF
jgi:PAS domain S-box-containing protein